MKKDFTQTLKILLAAIVLSLGMSYVYAWTAPTDVPPAGNTPAPINTGVSNQAKEGNLAVGTTDLPSQALEVFGNATVGGTAYLLGGINVGDTLTDTGIAGEDCTGLEGTFKFNGSNFLGCTGDSVWESLTTAAGQTQSQADSNTVNLAISGTKLNYVVANQPEVVSAIEANPGESLDIVVTIDDTGYIISPTPNTPAFRNGNLPAGSTVTIINSGDIVGMGGSGGTGGSVDASLTFNRRALDGGNGGRGGDAINLDDTYTEIDNTNGRILAGGGGGGGGGGFNCYANGSNGVCGTGGGGGGGNLAGGGSPGNGLYCNNDIAIEYFDYTASYDTDNTNDYNYRMSNNTYADDGYTPIFFGFGGTGGGGSVTGGGRGGYGGTVPNEKPGKVAGVGGAGGDAGQRGGDGTIPNTVSICIADNGNPGRGGEPGYAVVTNGSTLIWNGRGDVRGSIN